jgi:hypothetical protein
LENVMSYMASLRHNDRYENTLDVVTSVPADV